MAFSLTTHASPSSLTYQGRIVKSDGTPLEYNNVSFLFEITNPSGNCVIYREQRNTVNMMSSGGVFDVPIGTGTKLFPANPLFSLLDAFNNSANQDCDGGATYTPAQGDIRLLKVQFHDGSGWKAISPSSEIRTVPYAAFSLSSQKLGTKSESDFVAKSNVPTCAAGTFLAWDGTALSCNGVAGASGGTVTTVTSANSYVTIINNTSTPQVTLNVGTSANTVAAGNDARFTDARTPTGAAGGDLGGTYPNPSVVKIQGTDVTLTTPASGQYLKFNGSAFVNSAIAMADVTGLSANLATYQTTAAFNAAVGSANCAAHQTAYWNSVSSSFQCQSINVSVAGDVSGAIGAVSVDKIKGVAVDGTAPTNGQVLKFDGTKWMAANNVASGDGSALTNLNPANLSAVVPVNKGGTGQSSYTDGQILIGNSSGNTLSKSTLTAGTGVSITNGNGSITIATTGAAPTGAAGGDLSSTYPNPTVAKIRGVAVNATAPTNGQVLKYNGTDWAPAADTDTNSGGTVTNVTASAPLSVATGSTTPAISISQATTSTNGYLSSTDWNTFNNKQAAGNYLLNAGGTPSVQTGLDASKPASPTAGAIYFATDSKTIYQYNSGAWVAIASSDGSGGTITGVTAGTGLTGGGTTGAVTVNVNVGTGNNQILQLDGTAKIPAVNGSLITNLTPANLASAVPVNKGGTGQTSFLNGELLIGNTTGNTLTKATLTAGTGVSITNGTGTITIATTGAAPTGTASGDLSGSYPGPTVAKLQGYAVDTAAPAANKVLKWDSGTSKWTANFIKLSELTNNIGGSAFNVASCTAAQTMNWSSISDKFECQAISIPNTAVTGLGTASTKAAGTGANEVLLLDGSGRLPASALPSAMAQWQLNGANTYYSAGKVGVGTSTPYGQLDISYGGLYGMTVGADANATTRTDATMKWFRFAGYQYNNANSPFMIINAGSTSTDNNVWIGGGGSLNAATNIRLYTAANQTTTGGTERVTLTNTAMGINNTSPTETLNVNQTDSSSGVVVTNTSSTGVRSPGFTIKNYSGSTYGKPTFMMQSARGTSASATALADDDMLGQILFNGLYSGSSYATGAMIYAEAAETWSGSTAGTHLIFNTISSGAVTNTERMRIDGLTGRVGIGASQVNSLLQVGPNGSQANIYSTYVGSYYNAGGQGQYNGNWTSSNYWGLGPFSGTADSTLRLGITSDPKGTWNATQNLNLVVGGKIGIGTSAVPTQKLEIEDGNILINNEASDAAVYATAYTSAAATQGGTFVGSRARGTQAAPTYVLSGDLMGQFLAKDAITTTSSPGMVVYAGENHSASALGDYLTFRTTANGATTSAERVRIQGNGYVGIGTNAPTNLLTLKGASTGAQAFKVLSNGGANERASMMLGDWEMGQDVTMTAAKDLFFFDSATGNVRMTIGTNGWMSLNKNTTTIAPLGIYNATASYMGYEEGDTGTKFFHGVDGSHFWIRPGPTTASQNAFTVSAGGLVGINGAVNASYNFFVNGSAAGTSAYVNTSDARLKTNVKPIEGALDKILKLRGVTFDWKHDVRPELSFPQKNDMGVIAQEVEKVFPQAVETDKEGYKAVGYTRLVGPLIESTKELAGLCKMNQSQIAKLESLVAKQTREIASLKQENKDLKEAICEINPKAKICK
ncbi:tail fiber domain-containing protein [Bdellovibrio reynosensis]|uniref:Tail fiber domain-containing protein n=1 Tax=Bdellovibrio reynosensis TaxID=2835041 RepID=A0ABY4CD02_9BACT|nr:tail fiber domain-containing protein [Bdellovibrio reynosensis]UOF01546.1 tail fiber domain-containing protein [Bdellovibrio reynosensis]